jgi:hypothetical protein
MSLHRRAKASLHRREEAAIAGEQPDRMVRVEDQAAAPDLTDEGPLCTNVHQRRRPLLRRRGLMNADAAT